MCPVFALLLELGLDRKQQLVVGLELEYPLLESGVCLDRVVVLRDERLVGVHEDRDGSSQPLIGAGRLPTADGNAELRRQR